MSGPSSKSVANTIFNRPGSQPSAPRPKGQQVLKVNRFSANAQKTTQPQAEKRKLGRSLSSLSSLHNHTGFDENTFVKDEPIDLTGSPPSKQDVHYPQLEKIDYPDLPPVPTQSQKPPRSSAPVPWSSSPPEHFDKPAPQDVASTSEGGERPKKRRALPSSFQAEPDPPSEPLATPLSRPTSSSSKLQWDKSASAVKEAQKELRKKYAAKLGITKADPSASEEKASKIAGTHLSDEQRAVAKQVVDEERSVFFTGSAGTGKSVLMRSIISQLRKKYKREPDRVAITASTGLAACVIEGTTLHSWAGIGLGKEPAPELVKKIKRNQKTRQKWLRTKVLIVDEISMVDGQLFDKLEHIARAIRNNGRPFGGIQLVVTGDFFQLPPVPERGQTANFAFDAQTWKTCIEHTILLTHVFRQKDPVFANMLNEMRLGKLSPASVKAFQQLSRPLSFNDDVEATELFPTRGEVEGANNSRMQRLSGAVQTYQALDSGVAEQTQRDKILANFMAPESLTLKKGAQVMLIKNLDTQLVNGTLGKVISFMDEGTFTTYKHNEETYLTAYGDAPSDDENKIAAKAKFDAARFQYQDGKPPRFWPLVRFPLADGTYRDMLCQPEEWKTEGQNGEIVAKRNQVPLILAWALSIHKAQGQTLSRVKVDLGRVFERGQAYVALSRATSQQGLQVSRFDVRKVMVHPKVVDFYQKLINIADVGKSAAVKKSTEPEFVDLDDDEELLMYG